MNNPNHISKNLKIFVWVKILKFLDVDPGWKKFVSGIQDEKIRIRDRPGSAKLHLVFTVTIIYRICSGYCTGLVEKLVKLYKVKEP